MRKLKRARGLVCAIALAASLGPLGAADWSTLAGQSSVPVLPPKPASAPQMEDFDKWRIPETERLLKLATALEGFALEHPDDPNLLAVRDKEAEALYSAARLGHVGAESALAVLDRLRLSDPKLPLEARLGIRTRQANDVARLKYRESPEAGQIAYITEVRKLIKEFPDHPEPWMMLAAMADSDNLEPSVALLEEVRDDSHQPEPKAFAEAMLRRFNALAQPLELKFTALDGSSVNLQTLRGRVVLLDLWATFNEGSVTNLLTLPEVYEKYHAQGLEIVGLNFDLDPAAVREFVKSKNLPWAQGCDGQSWKTEFAVRYGIRSLPQLWLVDRKGLLRDLKGERNLRDKIELLLSEKAS